jgi:hypothetical protein
MMMVNNINQNAEATPAGKFHALVFRDQRGRQDHQKVITQTHLLFLALRSSTFGG